MFIVGVDEDHTVADVAARGEELPAEVGGHEDGGECTGVGGDVDVGEFGGIEAAGVEEVDAVESVEVAAGRRGRRRRGVCSRRGWARAGWFGLPSKSATRPRASARLPASVRAGRPFLSNSNACNRVCSRGPWRRRGRSHCHRYQRGASRCGVCRPAWGASGR